MSSGRRVSRILPCLPALWRDVNLWVERRGDVTPESFKISRYLAYSKSLHWLCTEIYISFRLLNEGKTRHKSYNRKTGETKLSSDTSWFPQFYRLLSTPYAHICDCQLFVRCASQYSNSISGRRYRAIRASFHYLEGRPSTSLSRWI